MCIKHLFLLAALISTTTFAAVEPQAITGLVTKVSDGDTIWVSQKIGQKDKVRLDRIDAPEHNQPYGIESMRYLYSRVFGKKVVVQYSKRDQYGRLLGIVLLDGSDINLEMVRTGNAWHYAHFDKTSSYRDAEKIARDGKAGLWSKANPINPYQWRQLHK